MNSMQRQFGKLLSGGRNPGDNARVSMIFSDFEDADKMLASIVDNAKLWRDSWVTLLTSQHLIVSEYEKLYDPIVGASDGHGQQLTPTPELQLNRTFRLRETYQELKTDLSQEVSQIEARVLQPAADARDLVVPVRKTIKKRENKRIDFDKSSDKVLKLQKKMGKTAKEDAALAKAEAEMERLQEDFISADNHLLDALPPLIEASFSLVPLLIDAVVQIQNTLLGLYYTYLNRFCEEHEFPSPPPPMEDVVDVWTAAFRPSQRQVESIPLIARGKGIRTTLNFGEEPTANPARNSVVGPRRSSSQPMVNQPSEGEEEQPPARPPRPGGLGRIPSVSSARSTQPSPRPSPNPSQTSVNVLPDYSGPHGYVTPTAFTTATHLSPVATRPKSEVFRRPSGSSLASSTAASAGLAAAVAAKKKPPPPPPPKPKRMVQDVFVMALYPFQGQGVGDLSFQEGDRIKIIEKTGTDQDWWVGELKGTRGNFPANYTQPM